MNTSDTNNSQDSAYTSKEQVEIKKAALDILGAMLENWDWSDYQTDSAYMVNSAKTENPALAEVEESDIYSAISAEVNDLIKRIGFEAASLTDGANQGEFEVGQYVQLILEQGAHAVGTIGEVVAIHDDGKEVDLLIDGKKYINFDVRSIDYTDDELEDY